VTEVCWIQQSGNWLATC